MKIGVCVVSYNMPEVVWDWHEYLGLSVTWPIETVYVDNGSMFKHRISKLIRGDKVLSISKNLRTTGGVMTGVDYLYQKGCTHVWPISTSTLPPKHPWNYDPVERLANVFVADHIVAVAPTFVGESNSWPHQLLFSNGLNMVENHWLVGLFAMWDIEYLMEHVDRRLSWSWGVDMEISALARVTGNGLYMHHGVPIRLRESIGYEKDRMGCSVLDREKYARAEMIEILSEKYGNDWLRKMVPWEEYRIKMGIS